MVPTSIEEAYRKFDELSAKHIERLRKFTKQIQDARLARDSELIKTNLKLYDEDLEKYIPILMAQARIYWDRENYPMVEKLFFQVRNVLCFLVFSFTLTHTHTRSPPPSQTLTQTPCRPPSHTHTLTDIHTHSDSHSH